MIVLILIVPQDAWAKSTPRALRLRWSQISFSDTEPDFVPPPPRDEETDPGEFNDEADLRDEEGQEEHLNADLYNEADQRESHRDSAETAVPLLDEGNAPTDSFESDHLRLEGGSEVQPFDDLEPLPPQREYFDPGINTDAYASDTWQIMPSGLLYRSYLAGEKEPRLASVWTNDKNGRTVWENTLGARVGVLRLGSVGAFRPHGFQLDLEGAALARVLPGTESTMLEATDYRVGILGTWAEDQWHIKAGYYHLSSHLGDEFVIANPLVTRFNYVRDSAILGLTYDLTDNWQTYGEIAYAMSAEDGAKPLEFQYGLQYSPLLFGLRGAPFAAINGHTREDFGYITSVNVQAGWQWRGPVSQKLLRAGFQYYRGPALQYSFPGQHDELIGGGVWIDF